MNQKTTHAIQLMSYLNGSFEQVKPRKRIEKSELIKHKVIAPGNTKKKRTEYN